MRKKINLIGTLLSLFLFQFAFALTSVSATDSQNKPDGFDFKTYVENEANNKIPPEIFFQNFPYDKYLQSVGFTNIQQMQRDRFFVYQEFGDGDPFVHYVGNFYISKNPLKNLQDVRKRIEIGEKFLDRNRSFGAKVNNLKVNEIYFNVGYFLLGTAARFIGTEIKRGSITENSPDVKPLIDRLNSHRVYIELPESTTNKILGRSASQTIQRAFEYVQMYLEQIRPYRWLVVIGGILLTLLLLGISAERAFLIKAPLRLFSLLLIGISGYLIYDSFKPMIKNAQPIQADSGWKPGYTLRQKYVLYPIDASGEYAVKTFDLLNSNGHEMGQAIWMRRPQIKVGYLAKSDANKNPVARFDAWRKDIRPVLVASGGYTNKSGFPEGLTFDYGEMVNSVLLPDREGLALFNCDGINVINLDDKDYNLPTDCSGDKSVPGGGNPQENLIAFSKLLTWVGDNNATLFQTHLLAFSNQLEIDENKAKPLSKERRLLAIVRDNNGGGEVSHIIFNIDKPHQLAAVAKEVFAILRSRNLKVEAILNLDTGGFNILEFYDQSGQVFKDTNGKPAIKGTVELLNATNLLVYYMDK